MACMGQDRNVWKENLKRKGCVEDVHIIVSV